MVGGKFKRFSYYLNRYAPGVYTNIFVATSNKTTDITLEGRILAIKNEIVHLENGIKKI